MLENNGTSVDRPLMGSDPPVAHPALCELAGSSGHGGPRPVPASLKVQAEEILSMDAVGLITDVDGTISRIVADPAVAEVNPEIIGSLKELSRHLSLVAVLSGRSVDQLRRFVAAEGLVYVGNHGLERWEDGQPVLVPGAGEYLQVMEEVLGHLSREMSVPGAIVENKGVTSTIHYRQCEDHSGARDAILGAATQGATSLNLRVTEGRKSVNLLPPIPYDKGTAVETLVQEYRLKRVIYLGDDSTDIDAFKALRRLASSEGCWVLLIGVCTAESPDELYPQADFCLPGVNSVAGFLRHCSRFVARNSPSEVVNGSTTIRGSGYWRDGARGRYP